MSEVDVECWYDKNTLFMGRARLSDDSFHHPFGEEKSHSVEINDLHVIVYINGVDHDLTKGFSEDSLSTFKMHFEAYIAENYLPYLIQNHNNDDDPEAA